MADDIPEFECPECDAVFSVIYRNSLQTYGGASHCPFCGDRFDYDDYRCDDEEE